MPELVKLYIQQVLIGFALAVVFVALLLWTNVANLQHLILNTQGGYLALFLLVFFNGIVFAGVQFAIAVMRMADDGAPGGGKGATLWQRLDAFLPSRSEITPQKISVEKPRR